MSAPVSFLVIRYRRIRNTVPLRKIYLSQTCALAALLLACYGGRSFGVTTQAQLDQTLSALQTKEVALGQIVSSLKIGQAFMSVGISTGVAGSQVVIPINFVPGPNPIVAVQGTIVLGSSISVVAISPGSSAIASGKSIASSENNFIVFGLNQNVIGQGILANLTLSLPANLTRNFYTVTIINPVASDANGNEVLMNTISGTVRVGL